MNISPTRLFIIALLAALTSGCEIQTLYEVRPSDLDVNQGRTVIRKDNVSLHLTMSNSTDTPGIALFAAVEGLEPTWDWEEFQDWPEEQQRSTFGAYYDRKHPSFDISFQSACPLRLERFEHRESAQEMAYGRWLHDIEPANGEFYDAPRGQTVLIPIEACDTDLDKLRSDPQLLVVSFTDTGIEGVESIQIEFRIGTVGTWLKVWGRSFQLN